MAQQISKNFCFATLAVGQTYRNIALLLAKDIEKYSPKTPFLVLTDNPKSFRGQTNVIAVKHRQYFYCDNDKKFLIEKALSMFESCICIDADMRILAPIPEDLKWLPGITARSCASLVKHNQIMINKGEIPRPSKVRDFDYIKKMAQKLDLNIENEDITFIYENLFVVTKDSGKEVEFLKLCEMISRYFDVHGVYIGVGSAMGLAAAKVGLPVRHDVMPGVCYFDDRIEQVKISKGQADPQETLIYFKQLKALKNPKRSAVEKLATKLFSKLDQFYRAGKIKIDTLKNVQFYQD
ncbi:hypothetical protein MiSe_34150 [Microseira wollei NIES-4236]|uniref:Uncharacterized protein n=2 Tax=Microseira wollei TaxID=467598 RepID=A0AAV3XBA5_9CYAN|nr:hypothetical protein MiSe_34150 [Microseira wollei NIES-4236]